MNKEIDEMLKQDNEVLKINLQLLLKAFDNLDTESRQIEFNKMAMAAGIIKQVIDSVRELSNDKFREILAKDEFVADTFRRIAIWNECGLDLGYTKKVENDNAKNDK